MDTSTYNPCLLITTTNSVFGVISIQTDNTIILRNKRFSAREKYKLTQVNYTAKPKEKLLVVIPLLFNSYMLSLNRTNMNLRQKGQANKLQIVDSELLDTYQRYIKQQARGAFIIFIY
jgi:hypothetical protein